MCVSEVSVRATVGVCEGVSVCKSESEVKLSKVGVSEGVRVSKDVA